MFNVEKGILFYENVVFSFKFLKCDVLDIMIFN